MATKGRGHHVRVFQKNKPVVLVLRGGPDAEREVSLMSGAEVAGALVESGLFTVVNEVIDQPTEQQLRELVRKHKAEVIFPVLHGPWGEGGGLQELLEELDVPYVGSKPRPARLAMDKLATKKILAQDHVPTPPAIQLSPEDECDLKPPLVLKPIDDGSSVDLRICRTWEEIEVARAELHPRRERLLAEEYIDGRELTVGYVCGDALPLIEIIPAVEYYDYDAKYVRDDTRYILDPDLPAGVTERCQELTLVACRRLGCRDVARVDFMLDARGPWLLEVNTMPGFTTHSLVPMAAAHAGRPMFELCAHLAQTALDRSPHWTPINVRSSFD